MTWALVRDNGSIFKQHKSKYRLLKNTIEIIEPISKKSVKNIRDGDALTLSYSKTYPKWVEHPKTGRLSQKSYTEITERTYTLRYIESKTQLRGVKTREKRTNLHAELHANDMETISQ